MIDYLNQLREEEFDQVFRNVNIDISTLKVLEIGSGTGHQLSLLRQKFKEAKGIELENSNYRKQRSEDIILYNGKDIPFDDNKFDYIFSSNVMEHIPDLKMMNEELARVVKKGGVAIHVMPTHTWRVWTTVSGYLSIPKKILISLFGIKGKQEPKIDSYKTTVPKNKAQILFNMLLPGRHGERGNVFTEIFYFHPNWWKKQFQESSWELTQSYGNQLFYTGHNLLGKSLSWKTRKNLAKLLGSSCKVYILKKK